MGHIENREEQCQEVQDVDANSASISNFNIAGAGDTAYVGLCNYDNTPL